MAVGVEVEVGVGVGVLVAVGVGVGEIVLAPRIKLPTNFIPRKIKEIYTNSIIKLTRTGKRLIEEKTPFIFEILLPMIKL